MERKKGNVKWFSEEKGFGFIATNDLPDIFVHRGCIQGIGHKTLVKGELVEFVPLVSSNPKFAEKGPIARNVTRLNPPADEIQYAGDSIIVYKRDED
jgi:CspA family cold shock protein